MRLNVPKQMMLMRLYSLHGKKKWKKLQKRRVIKWKIFMKSNWKKGRKKQMNQLIKVANSQFKYFHHILILAPLSKLFKACQEFWSFEMPPFFVFQQKASQNTLNIIVWWSLKGSGGSLELQSNFPLIKVVTNFGA